MDDSLPEDVDVQILGRTSNFQTAKIVPNKNSKFNIIFHLDLNLNDGRSCLFCADPDPNPTPVFNDFQDPKKFFFLITYRQAHYLQSLIYCFKDKFCVKILFCKHDFSPLNTFMRKRKDPDPVGPKHGDPPDPDPQHCTPILP